MNFLTMLTPFQWGAIGIAAAVLLFMYGKDILAWWNTPRANVPPPPPQIGTTAPPKPGIPTRGQVFDYADAIYSYFEEENCKEGMAAIETVVKHAFHKHDSEGHPTTTGAK